MIYFDNSATTKPYKEVLETYMTVSEQFFGNPSSIHKLGGKSEQLLSKARLQVADLLSVQPSEIIFTSGGTEGNNLAIKGTAMMHRSRGKHLITTEIEHPSIYEAYKQLEGIGFEVTYLSPDEDGFISVEKVAAALRENTILVSIIHVNNETGAIQPIREIGQFLKKYPKIFFHVDAVQGIGKVPLYIKQSAIDLLSVSGHKFHSVKGTGFLYVREGVTLSSMMTGGSQEREIRSGTENLAGIVAMARALRITLEKQKSKSDDLLKLRNELLYHLEKIDGAVINSPSSNFAPHILNISFVGLKPEVIVHALSEENIYISTKSACSSKNYEISRVLQSMGKSEQVAGSAIRISLSYENTIEEVKMFNEVMSEVIKNLYKVTR
ncbi:cysteine desulfurase family protein [Gottfriedia solisilvae]|uniref:Aminotransferase V n=1 Tax=Gottfriedia solisilvae TaxID=1516104 RepID=A0A8J3EWE4_9BACI|nr:cysteine desulfurase family protein [Gottfriedia solisilvae]GGI10161.1 aminotransferase V [Gottfriedia solisilvae]